MRELKGFLSPSVPELGIAQLCEKVKNYESGSEKSNLNPLMKSILPVIMTTEFMRCSKLGTFLGLPVVSTMLSSSVSRPMALRLL